MTANYDVIMLPWFDSQRMSNRGPHRRIGRKIIRLCQMLSWSHSYFRLKRACKAEEWACALLFVSEAYTTKTCTQCGANNGRVGGSKSFKCRHVD